MINHLISKLGAAKKMHLRMDSKLYYPNQFVAANFKIWMTQLKIVWKIQIVKPAFHLVTFLNGYIYDAPQFVGDKHKVYHLLKDLVIKADAATWNDKVKNNDKHTAHVRFVEHYDGEVHGVHHAVAAPLK